MLWPDHPRVRCAAIRERMADGSEGRRMRCIKGALHAHESMRAQGRTPGDEGRAAIAANREVRRRERELEAFRRADPQKQNEMILAAAQQEEQARVERLAQEWRDKQERFGVPKRPGEGGGGRVWHTTWDGI